MLNNLFRKNKKLKGVEIEDSIMTITQKEKALLEIPFRKKSLNGLWYFILIFLVVLACRVFYLDIISGDYYKELSRNNRIRTLVIKAPRGKITDKFGGILVSNIPSMDAVIIPSDLPTGYEERKAIIRTIADILHMEEGFIETAMESQNQKSLESILLKENISQDEALILAEKNKNLPGIMIENTAIRRYENSVIFSPIIGYDGKINREEMAKNPNYSMTDYIGKTGLEKYYEKELKGKNGAKQVEVDSLGNIKKNIGGINPQIGNDLVLNIDEGLQKKIYDSVAGMLEQTGTKTAAVIAIDPSNGAVLAMVSFPSYDNNLFAEGISGEDYGKIINDKSLPLFNRVISGEYPPGSTLKPAVAAAALSEGIINVDTTVNDSTGAIYIGAWKFGDWKIHGMVDVKKAIAESCDVFFYGIGGGHGNIQGLGMDKMKKYENLFGLGNLTGIDLHGEVSGFIPDENWKLETRKEKWYIGDSYHASIGQGFIKTTPLQLANYIAAIANNGILYEPHVVNRIKKNDGNLEIINPKIIRQNFISNKVLNIVRDGMRQVVVSGTAQTLKDLPIAVAGKTGTAQFGSEGKTHGWFVSFAPFDSPEIAMAVLVEGGGEGHSTAVPITRDVLGWYFSRHE
jgi:penicillin-binding protein 2